VKKIFKGLICAGLCGVLALGATGCSSSEHRDPETTALRLAIGKCDKKFNPMFYTAQNDGEIANMTQASLITADANGVIAYGDNFPVAALDYKETYYNENGDQTGTSDGKGKIEGTSWVNGSTKYEFLIKNDMKFSDGVDLTVMDILFNLYVYLDPMYTGSSTIYSTKIKGLQSYMRQVETDDNDTSGNSNLAYYPAALNRLNALIDWASDGGANPNEDDLSEQGKEDLAKAKELYKDEVESAWNSVAGGWVEAYKEYRFTEAWQVFYYIEGIVHNQTEIDTGSQSSVELKDNNGKYITTLDPEWDSAANDFKADSVPVHQELIDDMEAELTQAKVSDYMNEHNVSESEARLALQGKHAVKHVYDANSANSQIDYVLTYCNTRSTMLDYLIRSEKSANRKEGELDFPTISGITVSHTDAEEYGGKFNNKAYAKDHDVLRIEISGVDPKAKWNFGFSISPMHYYSDKAHTDAAMEAYENGSLYRNECTDFGVEWNDINWFNDVLAAKEKTAVPVGAGAYKCSTRTHTGKPTGTTFFDNGIAYYERNEYFHTMGANIENAKIKYVTYKEYPDDQIVSVLKTGEIDYGTPVATADNQRELNTGKLKQITYLAGGYGYVGINPKYVPDIEVRRAIMHALDTSALYDYYGQSLVNLINRPMSTTSWAYPKNSTRYYDRWTDAQQIIDLVESSGNWRYTDGKLRSRADNSVLKLTFTIAGESTDHPAYNMFVAAEKFLEQCGFEISVETNISALNALATGNLTVWAAAWSSSIDPDPYQIYSINSNASSTKNWAKDDIMTNEGGKYDTEYELALELNKRIVDGRNTINQTDRERIYGETTNTSIENGAQLSDLCALDIIMELAVEFPTYQRYDLCVYNSAVLDAKTMHTNATYNMGPIGELWKVNFKK